VKLRTLAIATTIGLAAEPISLQDGALRDWTSQRETLLKIAVAMPTEKFGFRPTSPQRTWGEQVLHIAEANVNQMGRLGSKTAPQPIDMKLTSPADILKALGDSFDYGAVVLKEQTDATLNPNFRAVTVFSAHGVPQSVVKTAASRGAGA
jgi:hypothetical protein